MAKKNLVSATLSPEAKAEIRSSLDAIRKRLDFLTSLEKSEAKTLLKVGNGYAPLLDKAFSALAAHPEIMPKVFSIDEFNCDYQLYKELAPIAENIKELHESVQKTMMALASDTMGSTLEIYKAVKQNRARVPGIGALADDMSTFFAKPKRKPSASKA